MSNVVEAEATSTPEAETTAKTPAVVAKPQEGEVAKAGEQKKTDAKPAAKEEAKPDVKPVTDAVKGETKPESTELVFKTPEGEPIEGPVIEAFTAMANDRKWTQEIADQELGRLSQSMTAARTALTVEWEKELRADKEFGGAKFDENVGGLRKAVERIGGVDAYAALVKDGLDKHPPTVRLLHAFAKAISADGFTAGVNMPGRPGQIANPNDTSVAAFSEAFKLKV